MVSARQNIDFDLLLGLDHNGVFLTDTNIGLSEFEPIPIGKNIVWIQLINCISFVEAKAEH